MKNQIIDPDDPALVDLIQNIRLVAFDFDGVFTDNMVYVSQNGEESIRCSRSDGLGLRKLDALGIETVIISTESNPVVQLRSQKLDIQCHQNCSDKLTTLEKLTEELSLTLKQVAFVGNDINDADCLAQVGLPIVVRDAHVDVLPYARYQTLLGGGHGAVREICDLFSKHLANKKL